MEQSDCDGGRKSAQNWVSSKREEWANLIDEQASFPTWNSIFSVLSYLKLHPSYNPLSRISNKSFFKTFIKKKITELDISGNFCYFKILFKY